VRAPPKKREGRSHAVSTRKKISASEGPTIVSGTVTAGGALAKKKRREARGESDSTHGRRREWTEKGGGFGVNTPMAAGIPTNEDRVGNYLARSGREREGGLRRVAKFKKKKGKNPRSKGRKKVSGKPRKKHEILCKKGRRKRRSERKTIGVDCNVRLCKSRVWIDGGKKVAEGGTK